MTYEELIKKDEEQLKKVLSIIKKDKLLNETTWKAYRDDGCLQAIFLYPDKSIFSQEIEDTFNIGELRSLNIHYKKGIIRTNRGSLTDISFYSIDESMKFINEIGLSVDFSVFEKDTEVVLSNYKNCVEILENYIKKIKKYKKGKKNG